MRRVWPAAVGVLAWGVSIAAAQTTAGPADELALTSGDVVVFLGDDLMDPGQPRNNYHFPLLVETFLTVRYPELRVRYVNAGWRGDTVERALLRLERDVLAHKPSVVVICLGLNDPQYLPLSEERLEAFRRDLTYLVERCREAGASTWLISPPSVEEELGRRARITREGRSAYADLAAIRYDETVRRYAAVIKDVADATVSGFVDWFAVSSAARTEARRRQSGFGFTRDGLLPQPRGHALIAAALLRAWGAEPIRLTIELNWDEGSARLFTPALDGASVPVQITQDGRRIIRLERAPMPWPMPPGRTTAFRADWEAASLCQFMLRIVNIPARGVFVARDSREAALPGEEVIDAARAQRGFNLAASEALGSHESLRELFTYIDTKNGCRYETWRRLELTPTREPELATARHKLIDAWNEYVRGYEAIIAERPKTFDVELTLAENAEPERLPTSQPARARPPVSSPAASRPATASAPAAPPPTASAPEAQPPTVSAPAAPPLTTRAIGAPTASTQPAPPATQTAPATQVAPVAHTAPAAP